MIICSTLNRFVYSNKSIGAGFLVYSNFTGEVDNEIYYISKLI